MAKAKLNAIGKVQSVARLSRTALSARLLAHGLYAGQDQIMMVLCNCETGLTPGQLAARLSVKPPTVTKTINRLQVQGFVEKQPSETDARQAIVRLTEPGRAAIRSIEKSVRKTEKQALKGLDKKELKTLSKLLGRIEANLTGLVEAEEEDEPERATAG